MANYYFWGDTDTDWDCASGDNWRDAANGGGNPYTGGAQLPPAGSDIYIENNMDCNTVVDHSATVFQTLDIEAGATLTVGNVGDIRFGTDNAEIDGTLHLDTGGAVYFTDINVTIDTTGATVLDGGILNFVTTGATVYYLYVNGSLTGTTNANGDTDITVSCSAAYKFKINHNNAAATISGLSAAKRLGIKGDAGVGAMYGVVFIIDNETVKWLHVDGAFYGVYCNQQRGCVIDGCDIEGSTIGVQGYTTACIIRDSYIHGNTTGVTASGGVTKIYNSFLGQNPALGADANGTDITGANCVVECFNTVWQTEAVTLWNGWITSTMHDGDAELFTQWIGPGPADTVHKVSSETTIVQAGRNAIKIETDAQTADTEQRRFEYLLAAWPATHDQTLDVTLYVRCDTEGATEKLTVIVDPESLYGTAVSEEIHIDGAAKFDDTWYQVTVGQYTVATNADEQMGIPIVIRTASADKTWFIDTLAVTVA